MRTYVTLILAVTCLFWVGCASYFDPDRNTKRTVSESEVVGTWTLTADTLAMLHRQGIVSDTAHPYTITLENDGTLHFASILAEIHGNRRIESAGTWILEHDTEGDSNIHKANALSMDIEVSGSSLHCYLNFTEEAGRLLLWSYHSDPDRGEFIEYEKESVKAGPKPAPTASPPASTTPISMRSSLESGPGCKSCSRGRARGRACYDGGA